MAEDSTQLAVWCAGDDWCPVTTTARPIGKEWHPVIVHRLLEDGPQGFNELKESVDGISSEVLPDSLSDLEASGIVDRDVVSEQPFRAEYSLTEPGADLQPIIEAMAEWGDEHLAEADEQSESVG